MNLPLEVRRLLTINNFFIMKKTNSLSLVHSFVKFTILSLILVVASPLLALVGDAAAQTVTGTTVSPDVDNNALVGTLCNALQIVTGNFGKGVAAFAIISVGIGFFTGKVSWGLMIGVAAGIAAMFGAPTIVAAVSGEESFDCSAQ